MKKLTQLLSMLFTITILLSACGGDDDDDDNNDDNDDMSPDTTIDISDPVAVSAEIVVAGATDIDGDPPAPSTDANAPLIDADDFDNDLISTQGGSLVIDIDVSSGDVAGTYLQIKGSDSYFDIPFNPNGRVLKRGRLLQNDEAPAIEIAIPDNLGIGTFCADVCVYDSEARVSNIVEVCVEITELGGANSDFLTGNGWTAVSFEDFDEAGVIEEIEIGELVVDTFPISLQCSDGSFETVDVTESDRTDKLDVTFAVNGGVTVTIEEFERDLDFDVSTCEQQVYTEEDATTTLIGTWSYNETSKELIMVLKVTSSTFTEDIGDIEVIEFDVEFDEATGTLRLTQDFDDDGDGGETIILEAS